MIANVAIVIGAGIGIVLGAASLAAFLWSVAVVLGLMS